MWVETAGRSHVVEDATLARDAETEVRREICNLLSCSSIFFQYLLLTNATGTSWHESLCGSERQQGQGSDGGNIMCKGPVAGEVGGTRKVNGAGPQGAGTM